MISVGELMTGPELKRDAVRVHPRRGASSASSSSDCFDCLIESNALHFISIFKPEWSHSKTPWYEAVRVIDLSGNESRLMNAIILKNTTSVLINDHKHNTPICNAF